jgi:hypothetical protein
MERSLLTAQTDIHSSKVSATFGPLREGPNDGKGVGSVRSAKRRQCGLADDLV